LSIDKQFYIMRNSQFEEEERTRLLLAFRVCACVRACV